ncbi:MAG: SAM-dependent methyltransferase [Corynebacterium sp.]|nr:SAM-dependent methyltransferase [Corynebacterium sp.]
MSFSPHEVNFLAEHKDEISNVRLPLTNASLIADIAALRAEFGEYARAIAELIQARRSAANKLPQDWLMCLDSAQQATPSAVAEVRARRLQRVLGEARALDVTCSIGTEGAALVNAGFEYFGADIDHSRLLMARHNVPAGHYARIDALTPALSAVDVVVADPARRSGGRRIAHPAQLIPPLPKLLDVWCERPLAVKCAPGLDFSEWDGLVSVVSIDGGVKEACLYSPTLSEGRRREAVVVRGDTTDVLDDTFDSDVRVAEIGEFIIDPDGAIVRAGLVKHFARREALWMLDERIAYLTGERIPKGYSGFRILEQVSMKSLKQRLRQLSCGSLEILVRGVDIDPDVLRRQCKLRGDRALALVCTRVGKRGVAYICAPRERG